MRKRLSLAGVALLLLAAGVATALQLRVMRFRGNPLVQIAIARAQHSAEVADALGAPVEARPWYAGSLADDAVDLDFTVRGPRGAGRLHVAGFRVPGALKFQELYVELGAGKRIDLIGTSQLR